MGPRMFGGPKLPRTLAKPTKGWCEKPNLKRRILKENIWGGKALNPSI